MPYSPHFHSPYMQYRLGEGFVLFRGLRSLRCRRNCDVCDELRSVTRPRCATARCESPPHPDHRRRRRHAPPSLGSARRGLPVNVVRRRVAQWPAGPARDSSTKRRTVPVAVLPVLLLSKRRRARRTPQTSLASSQAAREGGKVGVRISEG